MKIFLRTIFYQFLLLFVGGALGFILNAEYIGWKSVIIERSLQNIFCPVRYDERVEQLIRCFGQARLENYVLRPDRTLPPEFEILEDAVIWEEFYIARYAYRDEQGQRIEKFFKTRVRWKPWEYYYEYHPPEGVSMEELTDDLIVIDNSTLDDIIPTLEPPKAPGEN
jgi:hypothetical protein